MPITKACSASQLINPEDECYHGNITGEEATKRLKAMVFDGYLIRYSQAHKKYILTVLKKGLGQDEGSDLILGFEIVVEDNRCKLDGHENMFNSLKQLLAHYSKSSLHPSMQGIGACCHSPRYNGHMERRESRRAQRAAQALVREQREEQQRQLKDLEAKIKQLENKSCIIL